MYFPMLLRVSEIYKTHGSSIYPPQLVVFAFDPVRPAEWQIGRMAEWELSLVSVALQAVVIGSDIPDLTQSLIMDAFTALDTSDVNPACHPHCPQLGAAHMNLSMCSAIYSLLMWHPSTGVGAVCVWASEGRRVLLDGVHPPPASTVSGTGLARFGCSHPVQLRSIPHHAIMPSCPAWSVVGGPEHSLEHPRGVRPLPQGGRGGGPPSGSPRHPPTSVRHRHRARPGGVAPLGQQRAQADAVKGAHSHSPVQQRDGQAAGGAPGCHLDGDGDDECGERKGGCWPWEK